MTTWGLSFQRIESTHSETAILMVILSTLSPTNLTLKMLELGPLSLHHWTPDGEFEKLPKEQRWISSDMEFALGDQSRLRVLYQLYANSLLYVINLVAKPSSFIHLCIIGPYKSYHLIHESNC